jgi:hypothetical protein
MALEWEGLPHSPYLPDIASSDYHLIRAMVNFMQYKEFWNKIDLKHEIDEFLTSNNRQFWENGIVSLRESSLIMKMIILI